MALSITTAAAVQPLTTAEIKADLPLDHSNDNDRIADRLLPAATTEAETFTCRAFIHQTLTLTYRGFPWSGRILLPRPPLSSVSSINYIDTAGASQTWSSSKYTVTLAGGGSSGDYDLHGSIEPAFGEVYPATRDVPDSVTIVYVAGYGAAGSDVPSGIKAGISILFQQAYDKDRTDDGGELPMPSILENYRAEHFDLRFE